jgi:hypothetical protein
VTALLLAPIAVVLVVAWPASGDGLSRDEDGGVVAVGDTVDGVVAFGGVTHYAFTGTGETVHIGVRGAVTPTGGSFDSTIAVVDAASGEQLAADDDTNGVDPEVTLVVDAGREVRIEVRGFGDSAGSFSVYVQTGPGGGGDDDGTVTTAIFPPRPSPLPAPPETVIVD